MNDLDELKLAYVVDACNEIDGRVKMQKIVYLLCQMGYDLPFRDFRIRQFGPYSRMVACATDTLKNAEILDEKEYEMGMGRGGEPVIQYSYSVNSRLRDFVRKHFSIPAPAGRPPLHEIGPELQALDRSVLEVAATRVYLDRELGLKGEELEIELKRLKGHLESAFSDADELVESFVEKGWLKGLSGKDS